MGRAGLNRNSALATVTLAFASEFPDVDVFWSWTSAQSAFTHHRGVTHTLFFAPLVALGSWGVVYAAHHLLEKRRLKALDPEAEEKKRLAQEELPPELRKAPPQPIRWGVLYLYCLLATLGHLLFDFITAYGIRPFEPFNWKWYSWDIIAFFEPWMLVPLTAALVLPWFFALISSEVGVRKQQFRGRGFAITVLVYMVVYFWFADLQHRRAIHILSNQQFSGGAFVRADAFPYPINPFLWAGVVENDGAFINVRVNTSSGQLDDHSEPVVRNKPEETDITRAAKNSPLGRAYLDWARFPFTETQTVEGQQEGWRVKI